MLKKIKKLLAGDPVEGIAAIDIAALEAALDDAQRKRAGLLLDGSIDEILAAERKADTARIELERGQVAVAELDRRRAEAEAAERKAKIDAEYASVRDIVENAVTRIEEEYPDLAEKLVELVRLAQEADDATDAWARRYFNGQTGDLPLVDSVMERLGLHNRWMVNNLTVSSATRLLPIGEFEGHGCDWETAAHYHAVNGHAGLPVAAHQFT